MILIEPGHGGDQTGCRHFSIANNREYLEKDYNLDIAKGLKKLLDCEYNLGCTLARDTDVYVSQANRKILERKLSPDLVLSIHANSQLGKATLHGLQTYFWPGNKEGRALAKDIITYAPIRLRRYRHPFEAFDDPGDPNDDWLSRPQSVIGLYRATTVLVETGYMSYRHELEYLMSPTGKVAIIECLAKALYLWSKRR